MDIKIDKDVEIEHSSMTEPQRRLMRMRWLLKELNEDMLRQAEEKRLVEAGTVAFAKGMVTSVKEIDTVLAKAENMISNLTQIELDKLEDAYMWSLPHAQLTIEEQKKVMEMCIKNGQHELANEIKKTIEEKEENEQR